MTFRSVRRAGALMTMAGALGAVVAPAAPAAADPEAMPEPCAGVLITDKAGDQQIGPVLGNFPLTGTAATSKGPDNLDVKGVFFNTRTGDDGKTVTTANIRVTKLDKTVPSEFLTKRFSYVVDFDLFGDITFVRAENDNGNITFHAATVTKVDTPQGPQTRITGQKDLKGRFLEGPDGIVEIELPPELSKIGTKLENVYAYTSMRSDNEQYVGYINDQAPDDGATVASKKNYTVEECPEPEPVAAPEAPALPEAPAVSPPPPPSEPQPAAQQPAPAQTAKPASRSARRAKCQKKARKLKPAKKRKAALKRCKKLK